MKFNANNVDFNQYKSWPAYSTPTGHTYYIVPDGNGWLFDPFTSGQTGRIQLFSKTGIEKQIADKDQAKKILDQQNKMNDLALARAKPGYQIGMGLLPAAGSLGGKYLYDNLLDPKGEKGILGKLGDIFSNAFGGKPGTPNGDGTVNLGNGAATTTGSLASDAGAGLMDYSSTLPKSPGYNLGMDSQIGNYGSDVGTSSGGGFGGGAGGEVGASTGPDTGSFLSNLWGSGGSEAGAEPPPVGGSFLPSLGMVAGAYTGMQQFEGAKNAFSGKKLSGTQQAALALPTFGASLLWNKIPGLTHVSTKEQESKRWGDLVQRGVTGAQEAFAAAHSPDDTGVWKDGPTAGKEWNWEDAVSRAKANPSEFRGAYGNLDTFGNDWATYAPEQQDAIILKGLEEGLYDPEKGDITVTDKDRLRQIKDEVLNTDPQTSLVKQPGTVPSDLTSNNGLPLYFKNRTSTPGQSLPPLGNISAANIGQLIAQKFNEGLG